MTDLVFHKITEVEENGTGYDLLLDVTPDYVPDEAAEYKGALVRTGKSGWSWWARSRSDKSIGDIGSAETKEQAIEDGLKALNRIRARVLLTPPTKKRRWFG